MLQAAKSLADYREIPLNKADKKSEARGYITIEHFGLVPTDRLLHVNVFSLRPNTIYSVWIVDRNNGKRTPAGFPGENTFKTNGGGAGHFKDHTSEFTLGWNKLEIVRDSREAEKEGGLKVVLWAWMYQ